MAILEGRTISKRYGGFLALDSIDITVAKGEIRGLIGPNGAGKSTLIDCLSGQSKGFTGSVALEGQDISRMPIQQRRHLGLARSFQRINIFPDITVRKQLLVAARRSGLAGLDDVIDQLDLRPYLDMIAGKISYGHQRRLDLALALVGHPKMLLLDEPSAGLTVEESLVLSRVLKTLAKQWGVSVLIVEHDMDVIFAICDELTVLHLGKKLTEGRPANVRANPDVISAYLGSAA